MLLQLLLLLPAVRATFTYGTAASQDLLPACDTEVLCNGIMCADVCRDGTISVPSWLTWALDFQRNLTRARSFSLGPHLGTHNALISRTNGFGLEEDFASLLYSMTGPSAAATHVRIPNQRHGLLDLLALGVRHVEYDIWDVPDGTGNFSVHLCHSPVPDPLEVAALEEAALALHLPPLAWNPLLSLCSNLTLEWAMRSTKAWLEAHPTEFIGAYLDNRVAPWNADLITATLQSVWGDALLTPGDFRTLFNGTRGGLLPSRDALLAAGKRLYVESNSYLTTNFTPTSLASVAFYPPTWEAAWFGGGQPGPQDLTPFPNCTLAGLPATWYGSLWPRLLDSGDLAQSPAEEAEGGLVLQPVGVSDLVACGVNTIGMADVGLDTARAAVWSWAEGQPVAGAGGCAAMVQVRGRWGALPCETPLPVLCVRGSNAVAPLGAEAGAWNLTAGVGGGGVPWAQGGAACSAAGGGQWQMALPRDGRENAVAAQLALLGGVWGKWPGVWLNFQL